MPVSRRAVDRSSLEARSVFTAVEHLLRAARMREESRGSHFRSDFPERDDAHWQARIGWTSHGHELIPVGVPAS